MAAGPQQRPGCGPSPHTPSPCQPGAESAASDEEEEDARRSLLLLGLPLEQKTLICIIKLLINVSECAVPYSVETAQDFQASACTRALQHVQAQAGSPLVLGGGSSIRLDSVPFALGGWRGSQYGLD